MRCEKHDCPRPNETLNGGLEHSFSGYGYHVKYHPECCPKTMDGDTCSGIHPSKWELYWTEFATAMTARLAHGAAEYGEDSFSRSDAELRREIEEEILDVVGWSFVRWVAMKERGSSE